MCYMSDLLECPNFSRFGDIKRHVKANKRSEGQLAFEQPGPDCLNKRLFDVIVFWGEFGLKWYPTSLSFSVLIN